MEKRPKAVMQVFFYALIYSQEYPQAVIMPSVYFVQNIFDTSFSTAVEEKLPRESPQKWLILKNIKLNLKQSWTNALDEIFDTNVPFSQTKTGKPCDWCDFKTVCKK